MATRLWLLRRNTELKWAPVYDCNDGFVIRAETEADARKIASEQRGDEGSEVWLSSEKSTCDELLQSGDVGVVLQDFHAG
jgi:hypothetical protein